MGSEPRFPRDSEAESGCSVAWENQLADWSSDDQNVIKSNRVDSILGHVALSVNASTFYAGLMAWLGWFFFALFGAIGLAALPLDLILAFSDRPRHMDPLEFAEAQMSLRDRVNELVAVGELLKYEREEREQQNGGSELVSLTKKHESRPQKRNKQCCNSSRPSIC